MIDGTIKALENDAGSVYAPTTGVPQLKKLVADKLCKHNKVPATTENILVAPGGSGTISLAFSALFNPGDELVMASPNFVSYFHVARFFDAAVVEVPRRDDLSIDIDRMAASITPRTKAILINSPNNPTGYTMTRKETEAMASLCIDHDLYLVSDEVYEHIIYDGREHVSPASLNGMADRTITLNAASKTFSLTGFRVGYVCAPGPMVPLMENFLQYTSAGTNHPCQHGVIAGLDYFNEHPAMLDGVITSYSARRDLCYDRLNSMGLLCPKPGGAFYIMPDVHEATGMDGATFSMKLVEEKSVATVAGATFGSYSGNRVRISYALDDRKLAEALDRIEHFVSTVGHPE